MNPAFLRSALTLGALIALLNLVFASLDHGFSNLPAWFFAAQLLLLPAMLLTMRLFAQAAPTREFLPRALGYAAGWFVPYTIYKVSGDALRDNFDLRVSLVGVLLAVMIFGLVFAAIRKPQG